jgi:hypothetical protein
VVAAAPSDDAFVSELLEQRRLGTGEGSRGAFTVAKTRALLELRKLPKTEWRWTLHLVRAANVLSESPVAVVEREVIDEHVVTRLVFGVPGASFDGLELRDFLAAALRPDLGTALDESAPHAQRLGHWRGLVARALNEAMATEVSELQLITPAGGRRYVRSDHQDPDRDPFAPRPLPAQLQSQSFAIVLRESTSFGHKLGSLFGGKSDLAEKLTHLWRDAIVGADEENTAVDGMSLAPLLPGHPVALGEEARFTPKPDIGPWLVRDGVKILGLKEVLHKSQLPTRLLSGFIEAPGVHLTADESTVARDEAYELLVAWLHDMVAHTFGDETVPTPETVKWPEKLSAIPTASGYTISLEALQRRVDQGQDLLYVWCHQVGAVPSAARARVLQLWPSEARLLQTALRGSKLVPLRALGTNPEYERVDLTSLNQGSLDALPLEFDAKFETEDGETLVLDVVAYIHRYSTATLGAVVLLSYEREVAYVRDPRRTVPGLTLLCRIRSPDGQFDLDRLRGASKVTDLIARHCRQLADEHLESLLAHVNRSSNPWENPLVRAALDQLSAVRIGLRYVISGGRLRLEWDDSALLDLPVARDKDGNEYSLRDALERCRDVGLLVESAKSERWSTLVSGDAKLQPWIIDAHARAVFDRVVGPSVVLRMPAVPEAYPLARGVEDQRALLLKKDAAADDIKRSAADPWARLRLAGHLLVARANGRDELGLHTVALFSRYDPRAAAPTRLVSLQSALSESHAPGLAFPGAVSRELAGAVLEVPPGLAGLLHEVLELEPEAAPRPDASLVEGTIPGPVRKRSRESPALLTYPVVHPLAVGSLKIDADGRSHGVALWFKGLRVGELRLPEPLGRVSGRLWLTRQVRHEELETAVAAMGRELMQELVRTRGLLSLDGPRRAKFDAVIDYAKSKIAKNDRLDLAETFGVSSEKPTTEATLDRSLRAWPLQRLAPQVERWLAEIVIQSVGFRVNLDLAYLSWKVAKVQRIRRDGSIDLDLGSRNEWVRRALEAPKTGDKLTAFEAATLVLAEFFRQVKERNLADPSPANQAVAYWRLLALLVDNVGD